MDSISFQIVVWFL